jgi:hypothetical protein
VPATLSADHPLAVAAVHAIHIGDLDALSRLLADNPGLAAARLGDEREARTLLHVLTDWPGHSPAGAATVAALVDGRSGRRRPLRRPHAETPLHWAASCDDVTVLDALLDAGAGINADGAVIAGGTPLSDATAFGQWNAARRLIERGARSRLRESAALGLFERVKACFSTDPAPTMEEITGGLWGACHGGQRGLPSTCCPAARTSTVGWGDLTPLDAANATPPLSSPTGSAPSPARSATAASGEGQAPRHRGGEAR